MPRDSILDEAEQNQATDQDGAEDDAGDDQEDDDERVRLTQRTPKDLVDDVEAVQEQYHLPSRNAAINFMLKTASDDLLEE